MNKLLTAIATCFVLVALSGCQPAAVKTGLRLVDIRGNAIERDYPPLVSGFERGPVIAYEEGMQNYSVTYLYSAPEGAIIATVYEYKKRTPPRPFSQQLKSEQAGIVLQYPDARKIASKNRTVQHHGKRYKAHEATYKYRGEFFKKEQDLYSELWLIDRGTHWVKLRSTTPYANRQLAAKKNRQLMSLVNWTEF